MKITSALLGASKTQREQARVFAVAAGLFVIWGLALWLYNALYFKLSYFFGFSHVHVAWTLAAFHVAYILLAIPAVLFHRQFGYKLGILAGLSVFALGAFLLYLAMVQHSSAFFFSAVLVIGSCGAWLDTSLNPLAIVAGNPQTAVQRLNLAHAFNGFGLFAAYLIGITLLGNDYLLSTGVTAQLTARPYVLVGLGAILLAFLVEQITLPAFASKGTKKVTENISGLRAEIRLLLSDKAFLLAVVALCAYCAVLTFLWTANYKYHKIELPTHIIQIFERGWFWFAIGRLAGPVLMRWIDPVRLLQWCAALCLAAITLSAAIGGMTGWVCLLSGSLFLAITYPTVFGTALCQNPTRMALAAGLLVIGAGIGNALSSLVASLALDSLNLNPRVVVLMALPFEAVILMYALRSRASRKQVSTAAEPAMA
jgi:FHS family L-fucose permease-like MFS transporter